MKMQTCFALAHHPRFLILDEAVGKALILSSEKLSVNHAGYFK